MAETHEEVMQRLYGDRRRPGEQEVHWQARINKSKKAQELGGDAGEYRDLARASQERTAALEKELAATQAAGSSASLQTQKDIETGRKFGREILGEEGLGRLGTDPEVAETLDRFKGISEQGFSAPESLARREQAFEGIGQATQTAERALLARLSQAGVRGATAGRQLVDVQLQGLQQRASVERDIFLEGENLKRTGLKDFAEALGQVKTFDLAQAAREKDIEMAAGLGFAQLTGAERSGQVQAQAATQAAQAQASAACFGADTLVRMHDGSYKPISTIQIGNVTSHGVVSGISQHIIPYSEAVNVNGILVQKEHPMFDTYVNSWVMAKDATGSKEIYDAMDGLGVYVYDLWVTGNRIEAKSEKGDVLFTDYEGVESVSKMTEELLQELNAREAGNGFVSRVSTGKI